MRAARTARPRHGPPMLRGWIRGVAACLILTPITLASLGCSRRDVIPTATVTRGEFVNWLQLRAEVKAARAVTLRAPMESGELRIVSLLPTGSMVAAGATVAEFDPSTIARTVDEKRTEANGLAADIEKAQAESATREAESVTAETTARFEVERTRLDYSGRDVLSRVEAEQARLKVLDAEQKLREAEAKLASVRAESRASLAAAVEKRDKARRDLERAQTQLTSLRLVAPSPGSLTVMLNTRTPEPWQPFKPGDQVWPGAEIATLPDASSLYVVARVDEVERGRLTVGQPATVRAEALPDRELKARVQTISRLARTDFTSGWPPPRNFDLTVTLSDTDARLRPGLTVTLRIAVERLRDALTLPADAVFERDGQEIVYVMEGGQPRERRVSVDRRSDERVVVRSGVDPGEQVALVDPTVERSAR